MQTPPCHRNISIRLHGLTSSRGRRRHRAGGDHPWARLAPEEEKCEKKKVLSGDLMCYGSQTLLSQPGGGRNVVRAVLGLLPPAQSSPGVILAAQEMRSHLCGAQGPCKINRWSSSRPEPDSVHQKAVFGMGWVPVRAAGSQEPPHCPVTAPEPGP